MTKRQPVYFIPHGGGPWPFMDNSRFGGAWADLGEFLKAIRGQLPEKPKAIVAVTAHWDDESVVTVSAAEKPGMLYDYYGFPPNTYEIKYPAPGSPEIAGRIQSLLNEAGIPSAANVERGYDHGTFIPLMVAFPDADIPVVQVSLRSDLEPTFHIEFGKALAPLREEGILIIGSGLSYHNMRGFGSNDPRHVEQAQRFDDWLKGTLETDDIGHRDENLIHWWDNPDARACHFPTPEHFLPVMVAAGAGDGERGEQVFKGIVMDKPYSGYRWG